MPLGLEENTDAGKNVALGNMCLRRSTELIIRRKNINLPSIEFMPLGFSRTVSFSILTKSFVHFKLAKNLPSYFLITVGNFLSCLLKTGNVTYDKTPY